MHVYVIIGFLTLFQYEGCKTTQVASEYAGDLSTTVSGNTCTRWDLADVTFDPDLFPDVSLEDAANFCRNPDRKAEGVWCFTDPAGDEWELCDLPICTGRLVFILMAIGLKLNYLLLHDELI